MYFPPPPGQITEPNLSSGGSSSSSSSSTVTTPSSSSSSTIPPYNPAYATTQLPYSHARQKANGGGGGSGMPSLGPAATPSFGLSMNGPTIPLISSRPNKSFRRMSKYINKESAKKAYKTGLEYAAKTGEWVDRMAQPAMPLLAATHPDIAAACQLQQALRPGTMQQQQQQQQLGAAGASGSSSSSTGLAAVGGLAAAGLAGYAMLQAVSGDDSVGMTDSNSGFDTFTQMLAGATQQQTQPDMSTILQGATAGQQPDFVSAILQQQQQSSDTTSPLLGILAGGGAQGFQPDSSQQIMDAIQQQSAASTQTLLSAMQNYPSSTQGQQEFASQMLNSLIQQQQQQQPQAQANILAAIQQQQAVSTQALLSAMQGTSMNGQGYGSQAFASILQQQQQQQAANAQSMLSSLQQQQQPQTQNQPTQQASPAPSAAQQNPALSPQEQAAYEEQLLNAALQQQQQQQQQQHGTSSFASTPATQPGETFTHTLFQPATNPTQADPTSTSQTPHSPSFPYNDLPEPAQYQQPFIPHQAGVPNPSHYTGPTNCSYPAAPQPHPQAQQHTQQGPAGPNTSTPAASNTAATSQSLQQQTPVSEQPTFQGWPNNTHVEFTLNHSTPQNFALPQQTQQGSDFHQYSMVPSPATTMPAHHHPPDPVSATATPSAGATSQHQHQQQQQPQPVPHSQQTTPAPASSGALSDTNAATSIVGQQHSQHSVPQAAHHLSGPTNSNSSPEVTVNHQPSCNTDFHGQLTPGINISLNTTLDLNVSQPPPSTSLDTSSPFSPPRPDLPAVPRPPQEENKSATWIRHHLPVFGLQSILLPPETTLQETSPNTLIGDLDTHEGISFEMRLLYDTAQVKHEINSLRSTVATQNFVVVDPYSSHPSPATTTAKEGTEASPEGGVEAEVAATFNDNIEINNTESYVHTITLASTTADADGDIISLHKLVAVPSTIVDHGLVFSFYAPLLPPPPLDLDLNPLSPVEQFEKTIVDSIVWVDRRTVCRVVSEKLLGTWMLRTPLNPLKPSSAWPIPSVTGEGEEALESTVVEEVPRGSSLESVTIKNEAIIVSEAKSMRQCETRTLRFLEGRQYTYNRDIVNEPADMVRSTNSDDCSIKKDGEEPCPEDKEAYYDPNHTRGCFETYKNPDGVMHLVLADNCTGSVEVQIIKLTDRGMLVRGRDYVKTL
ncbi:hypothetical protein PG993_014746 [Apiospora rasikravindrae]|uniref:Uncharacterized protein n=1 Tax=Apiospora rasikravindrae TaxID=990691 RepID=A0ABR1RNX9_9PEZI